MWFREAQAFLIFKHPASVTSIGWAHFVHFMVCRGGPAGLSQVQTVRVALTLRQYKNHIFVKVSKTDAKR